MYVSHKSAYHMCVLFLKLLVTFLFSGIFPDSMDALNVPLDLRLKNNVFDVRAFHVWLKHTPWFSKKVNEFWKGVTVFSNLEPQWNESMGCYTLNFYDRVKLASKKNYQMIRPGDPNTIFFQFGKVPQTLIRSLVNSPLRLALRRWQRGFLRWIS